MITLDEFDKYRYDDFDLPFDCPRCGRDLLSWEREREICDLCLDDIQHELNQQDAEEPFDY